MATIRDAVGGSLFGLRRLLCDSEVLVQMYIDWNDVSFKYNRISSHDMPKPHVSGIAPSV